MNHSLSQQRRADVASILARIATDPAFRQQLQANPVQALPSVDSASALEVVGYCKVTCAYTCKVTRIPK